MFDSLQALGVPYARSELPQWFPARTMQSDYLGHFTPQIFHYVTHQDPRLRTEAHTLVYLTKTSLSTSVSMLTPPKPTPISCFTEPIGPTAYPPGTQNLSTYSPRGLGDKTLVSSLPSNRPSLSSLLSWSLLMIVVSQRYLSLKIHVLL